MNGKIKNLSDKGFGFIAIDGREKDLFFHSSALVGVSFNELRVGDSVEVAGIDETPKGFQASGVKLVA